MAKKHFSDLHPITYKMSVLKGIGLRRVQWGFGGKTYARTKAEEELPICIYKHTSLIRRKLGDVDEQLQNNKAVNLSLAAPKVNKILIRPGEVFSFWKVVGACTKKKGFKEGLVIRSGEVASGIGGGMCQFSNLIHWMVLHSPLEIIEHHHHNQIDMFPDYGRQIPFGTGTSIMYNYLDYQVKNTTGLTFQLITYTTDDYLCGELRSNEGLLESYHIVEEDACFIKEGEDYYRHNEIYRHVFNKKDGTLLFKEHLISNHSKVLYDASYIPPESIRGHIKEASARLGRTHDECD